MALVTPLIIFFTILITFSFTKLTATTTDDQVNSVITTLCYVDNSTKGSSSPSQTYRNNVYSLLSSLTSQSSDSHSTTIPGFYNTTIGEAPNKAYGSYLCRGDLNYRLCQRCVYNATKLLLDPFREFHPECFGMAGLHDESLCMVHYANHSTRYKKDSVITLGPIGSKVSNYLEYNKTLSTTMERLIREATYGNWSRPNFAKRVVEVPESHDHEKIYTLVQCTPEISAMNCSKCLGELYSAIPGCCNGTQGGMVIHADCLLKYNNQSFFGGAYGGFVPSYLHVHLVVLLSIYILYM